jgi:ATP-dependent 26S proteasome regulatory subunit
MAIKLSKKFEQEKCVVFSTNIADVAQHLAKCAAHNVSTIAILEDAESTLANANSSLLNFLDGVDLPKNINGSYIIMTTNHPDRIEPRILQRPGRVDKIIEFGNLTGSYVIKCAEIYFDEILFNDKNRSNTKIGKQIREELYPCINKMSGAEIKELSQASASYAVSEEREVTVELIKEVKNKMKEDIQSISKYASEQSSLAKRKVVGFDKTGEDAFFFSEKYLESAEPF